MHNKEFNKLFEAWKEEETGRVKDASAPKTKDCLYFTEFEAYVKDGCAALTSSQKQHIQDCGYCEKMIAAFKEAAQEEKQSAPIYERLTQLCEGFTNAITLPFKTLGRLRPALVPVFFVILIFLFFAPLLNQPPELKNYGFEFSQRASTGPYKIRLIANYDCYAYLFGIEDAKAGLLAQERITKGAENALPKENWLEGKGRLALLLAKDPIKELLAAQEVISRNHDKNEKLVSQTLRKALGRKEISFYNIKSP